MSIGALPGLLMILHNLSRRTGASPEVPEAAIGYAEEKRRRAAREAKEAEEEGREEEKRNFLGAEELANSIEINTDLDLAGIDIDLID